MEINPLDEIEKKLAAYKEELATRGVPTMSVRPESEVAVRQTQVSKECTHLADEIEKLHEVMGYLEDRLYPILRYSDPKPENVDKAESIVQHAEYIRGRAWDIAIIRERITDILQRLEL